MYFLPPINTPDFIIKFSGYFSKSCSAITVAFTANAVPAAIAAASITTPFTTNPETNGASAKDGPDKVPAVIAVAKAPAANAIGIATNENKFFIDLELSGRHVSS